MLPRGQRENEEQLLPTSGGARAVSDSTQAFLLTAAEISVAFVGFASLVGVFLSRGGGTMPPRARIALTSMLDYGLLALLACGIPLTLERMTLDSQMFWRVSSGVFLGCNIIYVALSHRLYREVAELHSHDRKLLARAALWGDAAAFGVLLFNSIAWPFQSSEFAYLCAAVVWFVIGSALSFRVLITLAWAKNEDES
jgi:hypothetical protein